MDKKFIKGLATGLVLSAVIGGTMALAEPFITNIEAVYNDIKIVVHGKQITPKDGDGNVVDPFISNGTTYLPVRAVSQALGETVDWDGSTNTVYIGGTTMSDEVDMSTIKAFEGNSFVTGQDAQFSLRQEMINADNLLKPEGVNIGDASVFLLGGKYTRLTGLFVYPDDESEGSSTLVFTNKDTGEVLASYETKRGEKPVEVDVDVTGVDKLSIAGQYDMRWGKYNYYHYYYSYFYNAYLTPITRK